MSFWSAAGELPGGAEGMHAARERELADLAAVADTPEGAALLERLLGRLGVGGMLGCEAGAVALRNEGLALARELGEASPLVCANILARLHGADIGGTVKSGTVKTGRGGNGR